MDKPKDKFKSNNKHFTEKEKQLILEQQKKYDECESFYDPEESVFLTGKVLLQILEKNSKVTH